jgi:serine/threonine protein kinase/tetratricopeptide (TPR) repeat protein
MSAFESQLSAHLAGRYTIERELGGGGMSRVFLATESALSRRVVIKVLSPELAQGLSAERFTREIRLAARLQHPHIVPLFTAGDVDGLPYYTMPFVEGESLRTRLDRGGAFSISSGVQVLRDVARALEYAHLHDVVHRDIKPDNVLLSGNSAVVTDFGIAKALTAAITHAGNAGATLTQFGFAIGTPTYMAPEQAAGDPDVDHRADIYAFGCLAYEMITGHPPFATKSTQALLVAHIMEIPAHISTRRPDTPSNLADIIMQCLEKEPQARPAAAGHLMSAMDSGEYRTSVSRQAAQAPRVSVSSVAPAPPMASIAVLPFESMSADKDNEYFSDGITEEIINALTQLEGLRVAGRTSSFTFKGSKQDLPTIGAKLNVATVLEGSVRRSGNRLRITAQLISVNDGFHMWSERYDRELTDVFEVQDEIATAIAAKLKITFTPAPETAKPRTDDIDAYELFLKGRIMFYRRGRWILSAIDCFQQAVAADPDFAQAQAGLSDALSLAGYYGMARPLDIIDRARVAAERAVACAPELAEAHHALALWMTLWGSDAAAAIAEWDRAGALGSSTQVRCSLALWRNACLRASYDEAVAGARAAVAADPLSGYANSLVVLLRSFTNDHAGIVEDAMRGVQLDPESFWSQWLLQRAYHYAGRHADAIIQARVVLGLSGRHPWALTDLGVAFWRLGDTEAAVGVYNELKARNATERIQPQALTLSGACAGKLDEAAEWCSQAIDTRDSLIRWALEPAWDGYQPLREHARWPELEKRLREW